MENQVLEPVVEEMPNGIADVGAESAQGEPGAKPKKAKRTKEKVRELVVLETADLRTMNNAEKNSLINALKSELNVANQQRDMYKDQAEKAIKRANETDKQIQTIINTANKKINTIYKMIETNTEAITAILGGK